MKIAHENQKKNAQRWMGCKGETLDIEPDRRQYLKNTKRDEEFEDVTNNDEDDDYFEFEPVSAKASNKCCFTTLVIIFIIKFLIKAKLS